MSCFVCLLRCIVCLSIDDRSIFGLYFNKTFLFTNLLTAVRPINECWHHIQKKPKKKPQKNPTIYQNIATLHHVDMHYAICYPARLLVFFYFVFVFCFFFSLQQMQCTFVDLCDII